jgi:hypothetical protein
MSTNTNRPEWQDDLFGGRDKVYIDKNENEVHLYQDTESRTENEDRGQGDYPHYTSNWMGDESWHYSDDSRTHKPLFSYKDTELLNESTESEETVDMKSLFEDYESRQEEETNAEDESFTESENESDNQSESESESEGEGEGE